MDLVAKAATIGLTGLLGLLLFVVPGQVAAALGVAGSDEFAYRSGGAAFVGYAAAFLIGWGSSNSELRILWLATLGAAIATAIAALIGLATGRPASVVLTLIVAGAIVVVVAAGYEIFRHGPVLPAATRRTFATWFVAFLGWGVLASALFGIGGLVLGSTFGTIAGFPGGDDPIYRLAGAATIGILVGSILAIRTQDWQLLRLPILLSFVTNLLTLVGGVLYISHGGVPPVAYLIAAAAVFNVAGLGLALSGRR